MDFNDFLVLALIAVVTIGGLFGLVLGIRAVELKFFNNVPVVVHVDGKEVYRGISGCVFVESSGANTTVRVDHGFLCIWPKAYYVSSDVKIVGEHTGQ